MGPDSGLLLSALPAPPCLPQNPCLQPPLTLTCVFKAFECHAATSSNHPGDSTTYIGSVGSEQQNPGDSAREGSQSCSSCDLALSWVGLKQSMPQPDVTWEAAKCTLHTWNAKSRPGVH